MTVSRIFPKVGGRLLRACLADWPIEIVEHAGALSSTPEVSVIIPVGGIDRLGSFEMVLKSFFAQRNVSLEIIVVEHSDVPEFATACSAEVQHIHLRRAPGEEFNKSKALNEGVRTASGPIVLLHDGDVVVPCDYLHGIVALIRVGCEAVRPVRFVFHFDESQSTDYKSSSGRSWPSQVEYVQQNNPGISTAVCRKVYEDIGGHDERFEGWGGEDLEFLDRLRVRRLCEGGFLPVIHLWHRPAPRKASGDRNARLMNGLRSVPAHERIRRLTDHKPGDTTRSC